MVFWLADYAGGLFVSFRDASSGKETYGAGRYVLDTAKGADLGTDAGGLILDFNFAYQPSCSYDERWSCPLPPRENWLTVPILGGERYPGNAVAREAARRSDLLTSEQGRHHRVDEVRAGLGEGPLQRIGKGLRRLGARGRHPESLCNGDEVDLRRGDVEHCNAR